MITSTSNSQVKQAAALAKRAKERRQTGLFVVEGRKMYEEAPEDWVEKVYVTEHYIEEYGQPKGSCPWEMVTEDVMRAMADTQTPQGILALVRQPRWKMEDVWRGEKPHMIFLETLQDPGNLGTILRAGEGAGLTGVVMNRETADIFNPKVIRSTMGSIYRMPFFYSQDLREDLTAAFGFRRREIRLKSVFRLQGRCPCTEKRYICRYSSLIRKL